MSIGLYDRDMCGYNQIPFNIDIMKLSAYYKRHREIVTLNTNLDPSRYGKFFYRQDYTTLDLPSEIFMMPNVSYGGRVFNPDKYVPFPEEIENVAPDVDIYDVWRPRFINSKESERLFKLLKHTDHIRLSLDGETVWSKAFSKIDFTTNRNTVLLHDYDLGKITDARYVIHDLFSKYEKFSTERKLGMKWPIILSDFDELMAWNEFKTSGFFYNIKYQGILTDDELDELIIQTQHTSKMRQFIYDITPENEEEFYYNTLPYLLNQIQKYNSIGYLQLTYDKKAFSSIDIINLLDLINKYGLYIQDIKNGRNSMFDYAKNVTANPYMVEEYKQGIRDIFNFVKTTNYELFSLMYTRHLYQLRGGKIYD